MTHKIAQYAFILLILSAIAGGYFYFQSTAAQKINSSQTPKLTDGLVGYWTFDGADMTATTATDKSTAGKNGTLSGSTKPTPSLGKIGQGLNFNGSTSYVDVAGFTQAFDPPFSIGVWMKLSAIPSGIQRVLFKDGAFVIYATGTEIYCVENTTGRGIQGAISWQVGQWYHIACTVSARDLIGADNHLYINGTESGFISDGWYNTNGSTSLKIGSRDSSSQFFNGQIDEPRIYNRALSASEITELYQQGQTKINASEVGKLTDGLVGHWTFDGADTNATQALDKSPVGSRHGTLAGASGSQNKPQPAIGKIGQALNFDGTDDDVFASTWTEAFLPPITYGAWIKLNAAPISDSFVLRKSGDFTMQISATRILCHEYNSGQAGVVKTISLNAGQWYHIMCVINQGGSGVTGNDIYINGVDSDAVSNGFYPSSSGDPLHIGTGSFNGKIDEVRVYSRALSASEITELYQQGQTKINASQVNKLTDGLVGYWTMDGQDTNWTNATTGTVADKSSSSPSNTGTLTSMSQLTSPVIGKVGQAMSFDGINDYINTGNASSINIIGEITVSAWIKPITQTGSRKVISQKQGTSFGWWLTYDELDNCGTGMVDFKVAGSNTCSSSIMTVNQWTHIIGTLDSSNRKLYINGQLENSLSGGSVGSSTQNHFIGGASGVTLFSGSIDEVRVYSRALSQSEVTELYNQGR